MNDVAIALIGFGGTFACLGLAYWVFRRGGARTTTSAIHEIATAPAEHQTPAPTRNASEPATEFISREEVLALAARRASKPATEPVTEFLTREEIFTRLGPTSSAAPATEVIPRAEILAAADRRLAPPSKEPSGTEFLSRDEILAAADRRAPKVEAPVAERMPVPEPVVAPPKFEPKHIPEPPPPAASVSTGPDIPDETLEQHLRAALEALDGLLDALAGPAPAIRQLADGPEQTWRGNVEVLSLARERVLEQMLLPILRNRVTPAPRRLGAALTLFELKGVEVATLVPALFDEIDAGGRTALLDALAHTDDARVDKIIIKRVQHGPATHHLDWLNVCIERGCELPADVLASLLAEKQPKLLAAGLRLLPFSPEPAKHAGIVDRHLVAGVPEVRGPAILAGLLLARPSAVLVSKQAARDPAMPLVCEALAAMGSDVDGKALIAWAGKDGAPPHAGWVLGLLGTVEALDACVGRLEHSDAAVVASALAGFRLASGFDGPASGARTWWAENRPKFDARGRHVGGRAISLAILQQRLMTASVELRRSISLELLLRSKGRVRLPVRRLPSTWSNAVTRLGDGAQELRF
jgi:hypothetical protein